MKSDFFDLKNLIRSLQRAEGNPDCFGRAQGHCDRLDCAWRRYCLEKPQDETPANKTNKARSMKTKLMQEISYPGEKRGGRP